METGLGVCSQYVLPPQLKVSHYLTAIGLMAHETDYGRLRELDTSAPFGPI